MLSNIYLWEIVRSWKSHYSLQAMLMNGKSSENKEEMKNLFKCILSELIWQAKETEIANDFHRQSNTRRFLQVVLQNYGSGINFCGHHVIDFDI